MSAIPISDTELLADYAGRFDSRTLQRGRTYAAEGRVRMKRVQRAPGEIHVEAEVQGTRARPYEVDLWLETDSGGAVVEFDNSCMCPVQQNCKHVVAVLLSLGQTKDIGSLAGQEGAARRNEGDFPEPSAATLEWLGGPHAPGGPPPPARPPGGGGRPSPPRWPPRRRRAAPSRA